MVSASDLILREATAVIIDSVTKAIDAMFNVRVNAEENISFGNDSKDYVCRAELTQNDTVAVLCFSFDHDLIEMLVMRVFSPEDIKDKAIYAAAASEIVNVACGSLKTFLNARGYNLKMSVPYMLLKAANKDGERPISSLKFSSSEEEAFDVGFYMRGGLAG